MADATTYRSKARSAQINFRLSPEDRELLRGRASAQGLTVQAYVESVLFDREPEIRHAGRPRRTPQQEELQMTV